MWVEGGGGWGCSGEMSSVTTRLCNHNYVYVKCLYNSLDCADEHNTTTVQRHCVCVRV